jgi:hypothetical protein
MEDVESHDGCRKYADVTCVDCDEELDGSNYEDHEHTDEQDWVR